MTIGHGLAPHLQPVRALTENLLEQWQPKDKRCASDDGTNHDPRSKVIQLGP
jgi:hypothetical protein